MSLIPDQSYSFPDHFLRNASRARAARDKSAAAPPPVNLEPTRPRPPAPAPVPPARTPTPSGPVQTPLPARTAVRPAPRSAALPKARVNLRTTGANAPAPSSPKLPQRASVAPKKVDLVQPRVELRTPSTDEAQMEMFVERQARSSKTGRGKFLRLMIAEGIALTVLIPSATLVLTRYLTDPTLIMVTNIVAITAAITTAMIPIILFAIAPTIPRGDR